MNVAHCDRNYVKSVSIKKFTIVVLFATVVVVVVFCCCSSNFIHKSNKCVTLINFARNLDISDTNTHSLTYSHSLAPPPQPAAAAAAVVMATYIEVYILCEIKFQCAAA